MKTTDWYLLCFVFGFVWSVASLLLGSLRIHGHVHGGHTHAGHLLHHGHAPTIRHLGRGGHSGSSAAWDFLNVHSLAIFLAWFGGCGYLMSRHTGIALVGVLLASVLAGLAASFVLVSFLRFLAARENVLDPFDYDMIGVLGHVSSPIRPGGTGEILFARDGARKAAAARSDDGETVQRGTEVVVTRYEKGIAYVRTWEAFAESGEEAGEEPKRDDGEAPRL